MQNTVHRDFLVLAGAIVYSHRFASSFAAARIFSKKVDPSLGLLKPAACNESAARTWSLYPGYDGHFVYAQGHLFRVDPIHRPSADTSGTMPHAHWPGCGSALLTT